MKVIEVRNVNEAYAKGLRHICDYGELQDSRAGEVLVAPTPVVIVYERPWECVLFDPSRDANPFFHVFESLWLLSGRNDARWLDQFVSDFSSRFAEEDGRLHGSYGFRWRKHFDVEGGGSPNLPDQLETIIELLQKNPRDRRCVLTMWDPVADLGANRKDLPCNTHVYFRVRKEQRGNDYGDGGYWPSLLDITVCCRSNDFVWGMTGANAVQFSFLQRYIAGRLGIGAGHYYQIANNCHLYTSILGKLETPLSEVKYPGIESLGVYWESWDDDLEAFMGWTDFELPGRTTVLYANPWFRDTATPMYLAHREWRTGDRQKARQILAAVENMSPDWKMACLAWMDRRLARMSKQEARTANV